MMEQQPSKDRPLRIGTRGSPLALAQAVETRARLMAAHGLAEDAFEIVPIKTTGDKVQDRPLSTLGGKGLFTREIEDALLAGSIDIGVHSMKDMPVEQPDGLVITCYLPREDPRDAFVSLSHGALADLPKGARIGTSSIRRQAQILLRRPDLQVVEFRGNVQTRLRKLREGVADATLLAVAGLVRLGLSDIAKAPIAVDMMLPAIAQGAIGIEQRVGDAVVTNLLAAIHDAPTGARLAAERAFLRRLDGSCQMPIAGLAELTGAGHLRFRGEILKPDGSDCLSDEREGLAKDAAAIGIAAAETLLTRAGPGYFD